MYGGWSQTGNGSVEGSVTETTYTYEEPVGVGIEYPFSTTFDRDGSVLAGARVGTWLPEEASGFGVAGDISVSRINSGPDDTDIILVPLSVLLLYRVPLIVSEDFPSGRLQPYIGIGLALVVSEVSTRAERADGSTITADAVTAGPGWSAHSGMAWCIDRSWSIFFEYRYLRSGNLSGSEEDSSETPIFPTFGPITETYTDIETSSIQAHQVICGITYNF
jgi:opacity protein-like surface antigen